MAHDFDSCDDCIDRRILESTRSFPGMAEEKNMLVLTVSELLDDSKQVTGKWMCQSL